MNGWLNRNATQCTDERRIGAPVGIVAARCIEPVDIARKDNVPEDRTNTSSGEMHEDEKMLYMSIGAQRRLIKV